MTFHLEFIAASAADAQAIVAQNTDIPAPVAAYLTQALSAYTRPNAPATFVSVKANGHLYNNDNVDSGCEIEVRRVNVMAPTGNAAVPTPQVLAPFPGTETGPGPFPQSTPPGMTPPLTGRMTTPPGPTPPLTTLQTTGATHGNLVLDNLGTNVHVLGALSGMPINGPDLQPSTTIKSIAPDGLSLELSLVATGSHPGGTYTFG